jgi:tRNA pseudouridine38-40 synthase
VAAASQKLDSSSVVTYQSIVAYDGTRFEGFQRQREGHRTVQAVLEDALRAVGWQERALKAAGRTDSGVHAEGQVIAYRLAWDHATVDLSAALNANLPADVAVRRTKRATGDFHPRFDAVSRRYRYSIFIDPVRDPLRERYAWRLTDQPELALLSSASDLFVGEHDFAAFGRPPRENTSTVRQVSLSQWQSEGDVFVFHIEANAFLYHMVRHITAAIVEVGLGFGELSDLAVLIDDPTRRREGRLAPAAGLCLVNVNYADGGASRKTG